MGRMKQLSKEERRAERERLYADLEAGRISIGEAVKRMRRVAAMTQTEYAERVAGISRGALAQIERDEGNPTLETLRALGRAFGLDVGFVRPAKRPPGPSGSPE